MSRESQEVSRNEVDAEYSIALPPRTLLRRHRIKRHHHVLGGNGGASANYGSASNSNTTGQSNSNFQGGDF
ncbi:MAG TPA: hypothetical protein VF120_07770 [Ktedonobacterales bacterium]